MMKMKGYAGKVSNKGSQEVKAPIPQSAGKAPNVKEGKLR